MSVFSPDFYKFSSPFHENQITFMEGAQKEEAALKWSLLETGGELIGAPFDICLEDGYRPKSYNLSFWNHHEECIAGASQTRGCVRFLEKLPPTVRQDFEKIAGFFGSFGNRSARLDSRGADYDSLRGAYNTLWNYDVFLDPRATFLAEWHNDNRNSVMEDMLAQAELMRPSMEWASRQPNAQRAAQIYLYSVVAPHLGVAKPESQDVVAEVQRHLDRGTIPEVNLLGDELLVLPPSKAALGPAKIFRRPWVSREIQDFVQLNEAMPEIAKDYQEFRTGKWARAQRHAIP